MEPFLGFAEGGGGWCRGASIVGIVSFPDFASLEMPRGRMRRGGGVGLSFSKTRKPGRRSEPYRLGSGRRKTKDAAVFDAGPRVAGRGGGLDEPRGEFQGGFGNAAHDAGVAAGEPFEEKRRSFDVRRIGERKHGESGGFVGRWCSATARRPHGEGSCVSCESGAVESSQSGCIAFRTSSFLSGGRRRLA